MKILITGATGYIGHKLAMEAAERNFTVHILVRDIQSKLLPIHPNIIPFKGDVTDKESVLQAMKGCKQVMHAAALTRLLNKDNSVFYKVNVEGTRNILEAALESGVNKLVYTSSGAVIGPSDKYPMSENDPRITAFENDYEISKYWAEELVKEYSRRGLFAVIVVATKVYGPGIGGGGNFFDRFLRTIFSINTAFVPFCSEVVGNYGFIDDIVSGHFLALEKGLGGEKYILGGENITYSTLFKTIKEFAGKKIRLIRIPKFLILTWSFLHMTLCWLTGKHTNISPKTIYRFTKNRALNCNKAIRQLGYTITPFTEGMQKTIYHLKNKTYA